MTIDKSCRPSFERQPQTALPANSPNRCKPFDSLRSLRAFASAHSRACHERGPEGPSRMERETGIEPATNSLEGCDSTTELLPPTSASPLAASARQAPVPLAGSTAPLEAPRCTRSQPDARHPKRFTCPNPPVQPKLAQIPISPVQPKLAKRAKADGEGRIRTSEVARTTDLQSAAFDRFATSPKLSRRFSVGVRSAADCTGPRWLVRICLLMKTRDPGRAGHH